LINVKDSFTRMRIEKDAEKRQRIEQQQAIVAEQVARKVRREQVKGDLYGLFGEPDAHKRGKALEGVLNELFARHDVLVRQSFTIKGKCSEGIIEQIDGLIEIAGHSYLVEVKWWNAPLGVNEVAPHLVRVFGRGGQARGLFVSYTSFTAPAITECRNALAGGAVIVLATLQEIVALLERDGDLPAWLKRKVDAAVIDKDPLFTGS
jgi:restriction system protein